VAVDPADAGAVLLAAKRAGVTIEAVLTTHYHQDHRCDIAVFTMSAANHTIDAQLTLVY